MRQSMRCFVLATFVYLALTLNVHAGVLVSPARLEAVVDSSGRIPDVTVINRGPEEVAVRFSLAGGGHDINGMPVFDESPDIQRSLAQYVKISPQERIITPGETVAIHISIQGEVDALYPVLIADIIPMQTKTGGVIASTRIGVPMLLTTEASKALPELVAAQAVRVSQDEPGGTLMIETVLQNAGQTHTRTGGRLIITGTNLTEEVYFRPVTILPGFARLVQVPWTPTALPSGDYLVQILPESDQLIIASGSFAVVRPYELAQVNVELEQLHVSYELPGTLLVQALVANRGNVGTEAQLEFKVIAADGSVLFSEGTDEKLDTGSGLLITRSISVTGVAPGNYSVLAVLHQHGVQIAALEQPWSIPITHLASR